MENGVVYDQRWRQGYKVRDQGQEHRRNPWPGTALPRTDPLEAKDMNARGQGPRTQAQVFPKKKRSSKIFFRHSQKKRSSK